MMSLTKVLSADCVQAHLAVTSQKRALEHISVLLAHEDTAQQDAIFADSLTEPRIALLTLAEPIEFEGSEVPVDLFVGLVVPQDNPEAHVALLSHITTLLRQEGLRATLREAQNNGSLYNAVLMATVVHED